ncbi:MAG: hypothetical protein KDC10_09225, partial [Calditrichaeota bacterium]|nr:hypothetical protein [Calditrichota bacterium]
MRHLLALLGLAGCVLAQVPELLDSRPGADCFRLAPWPAGGLVAGGNGVLQLVSPTPELAPVMGEWLSPGTLSGLAGDGEHLLQTLGGAGLLVWDASTGLSAPWTLAVPATKVCVDQDWATSAAGSQLSLIQLNGAAPEVVHTASLPSACAALAQRDTLLYAFDDSQLHLYHIDATGFALRTSQTLSAPVLKARVSADELLLVHMDGVVERISLNAQGRPTGSENWSSMLAPNDILALGSQRYLLSVPGTGLLPLFWPAGEAAQPGTPRRFADWNGQLCALGNGRIAVAEGEAGGALYLTDSEGVPQALGRFSTRPLARKLLLDDQLPHHVWLLDGRLGLRRFHSELLTERMQLAFPRPVIGGDLREGWAGAVTEGSGLRFYQVFADSSAINGIHSTDPIVDLAMGPELMLAYITSNGFVAIKQINPFPYTLFHYGTIFLNCLPGAAFWVGDQFFLGSQDGRLFHVDVSDPLTPALVETLQLAGPVSDADPYPPAALDRMLVSAGDLYRLAFQGAGPVMIEDSYHHAWGPVTCASVGELICFATGNTPV